MCRRMRVPVDRSTRNVSVISAGVKLITESRRKEDVIAFAKDIAERLQIIGLRIFNARWKSRQSLIEVNPRFSGGIPLNHRGRVHFL